MIFSENPGDLGSCRGKGRRHRKLPWGPSAAAFLTGKRLACSFLKGLNFCQRRWSLIHLVSNHSLWGWTKRHQGHFQFPSSSTCSQTNSATYGRWTHLHTPSAFLGSFPSNNLYLLFFFLALSKHAFPKTLGSPTFGASSKAPLPSSGRLSDFHAGWNGMPFPALPILLFWAVAEIYRVVFSILLSQTWCKPNELLFIMWFFWGWHKVRAICFYTIIRTQ